MKVLYLHLTPLADKRANVIQVLHMCNALQRIGIDVTLAIPKDSRGLRNTDIIKHEMGMPVRFEIQEYPKYTIKSRPTALGAYRGIKAILNKNKHYDYCYVRNSLMARLAINCGFKTIYEVHDEKLHPSELLNRWYHKGFLKDVYSKNLVKIITISQALADVWIRRGVPSEKILVLHDGVDSDGYKTVKTQNQARLELGINIKKKIVMYVGSLYEDREIENILKLAGSFPDSIFMVVGGPEKHRVAYERRARRQGLSNITFEGRVPHYKVKDYLFAADILLMLWSRAVPTIRVCSPLKVFEYMAAERVIVGHGFPTIKEVLKDKDTALLADPDSYKDLEAKLRNAISLDYPNDMAKRSRYTALTKYSWKKRAAAIVEALY